MAGEVVNENLVLLSKCDVSRQERASNTATSHMLHVGQYLKNNMNKTIYFLLALLIVSCGSPKETNTATQEDEIKELKADLDQILHTDQTLRGLFNPDITEEKRNEILSEFGYTKEEFEKLNWKIVERQDSLNLLRVEEIIAKYGYPGKSLVGEPTNKSAYYVIQHSDKIEKYFPLIKEAGEQNEIPNRLVAMMHDRLLVDQGKEQIYGTQLYGQMVINKETGTEEWFQFLWPIANPDKVNELRKEVGFTESVEEYVTSMGLEYKLYSLEDINKLTEK